MKIINGSPNFGSPMTADELKNFLSKTKLNIRLGTVDEKGDPNVHPTWYYFDNGRIYVETSKGSKKVENIRAKNTVYFCVDDENIPYKGVRGKATASISEDINRNIPIAEKIMIKYLGSLEDKIAKFLMESVRSGRSVILELTPHYYSTWDYSKTSI